MKKRGEIRGGSADDISLLILIPVLFVVLFAVAFAKAEVVTSGAINQEKGEMKDQRTKSINNFKLGMELSYSSNLRDDDSPDKEDSTSLILTPVISFNEKSELESRIDLIQDHQDEKQSKFSNAIMIFNPYTIELSKNLKFKPKVGGVLPTDSVAYRDDSYRGGISLRPTFIWNVTEVPGLTLQGVINGTRSFHNFEVKRDGSANTEISLRLRNIISYEITSKIYVELVNDYVRARTYNGFSRESFFFSQEVGYEVFPTWTVSLSHTNEGATSGPNNSGNNVDVFDSKSSEVGIGIGKVF